MFGWFKKAPPDRPYTDRVYATGAARLRALRSEVTNGPTLLVAPFEADEDVLAADLERSGVPFTRVTDLPTPWGAAALVLVRADRIGRIAGRPPEGTRALVYGHFPHPSDGRALMEAVAAIVEAPPVVLSALDEPLLLRFGGQRTAGLLGELGLGEDESVEHTLVKQAMTNARERVGAAVKVPREARSAEEWLARNLP